MKKVFAYVLPAVIFGSIFGSIMYLAISYILPGVPMSLSGMIVGGWLAVAIPPHLSTYDDFLVFVLARLISSVILTVLVVIIASVLGYWSWVAIHLMALWLVCLILGTTIYFCDLGWQMLNKMMS